MGAKLNDIFSFISEKSAKLFLTLFRLVAVSGIGYLTFDSIKKYASKLLIAPLHSFFLVRLATSLILFFMVLFLITVLAKKQ